MDHADGRLKGIILDYLEDVIERSPDKIAFSEIHPEPDVLPPGKGTDSITFEALDRRSNAIANTLRTHGVDSGHTVSIQLPNWIEFPLVYLGALKAGAVTNPLLPAFREAELRHALSICETDLLVIPAEFRGHSYIDMIENLLDKGAIDIDYLVVVGGDADNPVARPYAWLEQAPDTVVISPLTADDITQITFTTGTTGEPKGVRQTGRTGMYQLLCPNEVMQIDGDDRLFGAMPLAHNAGFHYSMRMPLATGAQTVLFDKWNPTCALETLEAEAVPIFIGPIVFLADLLDHPDVMDYPLPDLELFKSSGSPRNESVIERAYETFENLTVMAGWGQTENGMVTLTRRDDPVWRTIETDGAPVPAMQITVRDDADEDVIGEPGELLVKGPALFDGYHRRPELTEAALTDDGWFMSGDIAVIGEDGYVRVTGRKKDIVIRGGENISAREVEDALVAHPAIKAAALVGVPDERLNERPAAYVEPEPGRTVTSDELLDFLDEYGLQKHKHPEYVVIDDDIPRNQIGKIDKEAVRSRILDRLAL